MEFLDKIRYALCCAIVAVMAAIPSDALAQMVQVTVHTKIVRGSGKSEQQTVESVRYCQFRSLKKADEAKAKLAEAIEKAQKNATLGDYEGVEAAIQATSKKLDIVWEVSQPTGIFQTNAIVGSGILVLGATDGLVTRKIEGKGDMEIIVRSNRQELQTVNVVGQGKRLNFTDVPTIDTGNTARFTINYWLGKGETNERNRLIIQPIVIECQTEDTVAYLQPFVYEGEEYHKLQDKRFAYDFQDKDPLACGYDPQIVLSADREFEMSEGISYAKPNKDASYRCVYPVVLEDYHHVISRRGKESGSCNAIKPFKFLDLSSAVAELPLTSEFKEDAQSRFDEFNQDIKLTFMNNSDELTDDSLNMAELKKLSQELRSYGDKLFQLTVQGGASAEGSIEHNTKLAQQRANRALRMLSQYGLPSDVARTTLPPKVSTWDDVIAAVEQQGNNEITEAVKNIVQNHKPNEVWGILKGQPFFESVIDPIMVSQRMMRCTYLVSKERVMEPDEAVEEYFAHKKQYIKRDKSVKALSMGDFYNLFSVIKDKQELDTLTTLAYSQLIEQPRYETVPIAPYLANRKAVMDLRAGIADTTTLKPFIDFSKRVDLKIDIDAYHKRKINIPEMLINQALTYFMAKSERSGEANYILWTWLPQTEQVKKAQMLGTFQNLYLPYITGGLTDPADIKKAQDAEAYVLNESEENRAIIYTELHKFTGKKRQDVEPLVDKLSDDNAKKWYLKALLWVDEAGKEPHLDNNTAGGGGSFKELSFEEELKLQREDPEAYEEYTKKLEEYLDSQKKKAEAAKQLNVDNVPYFLAYFQHSFDLEPSYKKMFYREGNIDEATRKKYPYKKKDIEAYRRKFELIKAAEDRARQYEAADVDNGNADSTGTSEVPTNE